MIIETDPEKFDKDVREVMKEYFTEPMAQAIDSGITPPVLVEALLRSAYTALDISAQDNRHNIGWAFRKLADSTATMFEKQSEI